jgi:hypothetical protein
VFSKGATTGVEALGYLLAGGDRDVGRQERVEPSQKPVDGDARHRREARDLTERVHARVGAPGPLHAQLGLAGHLAERLLERLLDRRCVGLPLPAAVGRAVVLQDQL